MFFAPYGPHKPKRSATADRKEAPSANRANRRTISVPFSGSCADFGFIQGPFLRPDRSTNGERSSELPLPGNLRRTVQFDRQIQDFALHPSFASFVHCKGSRC